MTLKQQSFTAQDVGSFWSSLMQAASTRRAQAALPSGQAAALGMGRAKVQLKVREEEDTEA